MSIEKELIKIDYTAEYIPESVKNFRPDIYRDGDMYHVILGAGSSAVTGSGNSLEEALKQWDEAYLKRKYNDKEGK